MVFAWYYGFLHYLQLASHELATIGINVTKNKIQILAFNFANGNDSLTSSNFALLWCQ